MRWNEAKLLGVNYRNGDGSSRREELAHCSTGDRVALAREPANPHDGNAVAVLSSRGVQLGYLPREEAKAVAPLLDAGMTCNARLSVLSGGTPARPNFAAWIEYVIEADSMH